MSHDLPPELSFEELLQRARAGEKSAFNELFRRSRKTLDSWAIRRLARSAPGDARLSDISQAISERVLLAFPTFRGSTAGEWFGWLKKVFNSHMTQSLRAARTLKRDAPDGLVSLDSEEAEEVASRNTSPSQVTADREEWHTLFACLFKLPEDQREAILLRYVKDLPVAEVARLMNKTPLSVAGLLHRGVAQVKEWTKESSQASPGAARKAPPLDDAADTFMAYLRLCDSGPPPEPEAFLAAHPECADELRDMLHWIERLRALRPTASKK
ncbi:MAG TPA: sigma-70 family RNA polymerase sigma factor [Archangium sp.]|jgi:RNA polymerase sigma-70 factor (ECF subfamily)|uniref:sigma-70 family RNA polymerase sigma factor n=1 Tax=Archangium sp. TaxID=1872627 RepID=UPI002EDAABB1